MEEIKKKVAYKANKSVRGKSEYVYDNDNSWNIDGSNEIKGSIESIIQNEESSPYGQEQDDDEEYEIRSGYGSEINQGDDSPVVTPIKDPEVKS